MICECDRHDCSIHEPKLIENFFLHRVHFQHSFSLYELSEYFESQPPHRHCVFEKSINKFVCIRSCNLSGDSKIFKTSLIPNTILGKPWLLQSQSKHATYGCHFWDQSWFHSKRRTFVYTTQSQTEIHISHACFSFLC